MYTCYVDESGDFSTVESVSSTNQPVFVVCGLILPQCQLREVTHQFLKIKKQFFPGLKIGSVKRNNLRSPPQFLDWVLAEIKGTELRGAFRTGNRDQRRHALGFMSRTLDLVEAAKGKLVGRVLVKEIGRPVNDRSFYTNSIQRITTHFNHLLEADGEQGVMILDSRDPWKNSLVSHSLFTQKHQSGSDAIPKLLEVPVFGHSENHVPLQICDVICSSILSPMAGLAYCKSLKNDAHNHPNYTYIRDMFYSQIQKILYSYRLDGEFRGGIQVRDGMGQQPHTLLFGWK